MPFLAYTRVRWCPISVPDPSLSRQTQRTHALQLSILRAPNSIWLLAFTPNQTRGKPTPWLTCIFVYGTLAQWRASPAKPCQRSEPRSQHRPGAYQQMYDEIEPSYRRCKHLFCLEQVSAMRVCSTLMRCLLDAVPTQRSGACRAHAAAEHPIVLD